MTALVFEVMGRRDRWGLKGPRAAEWLVTQGIVLPMAPNTWAHSSAARNSTAAGGAPARDDSDALLVARLGTAEFFLEDAAAGTTLHRIAPALAANPPGVYPVLREDSAFQLSGDGVHEVLGQVCNVQFAALPLDAHAVIMTLMIGVAVLVVPQKMRGGTEAERRYRIWCDPTFGPFLSETLEVVVVDCGGMIRRAST